MKDQSKIDVDSPTEKWDRAKSLLLESLYKPDDSLRSCSHNQQCFKEMMALRDEVIDYVIELKNPHSGLSKPLKKWGQMSEHTPNNDDKIPRWFYNTVISMGLMVFVAFGLILFGMLQA